MFCPKCGMQVDEGRFCPNCGSPLAQSGVTPEQPALPDEPKYASADPSAYNSPLLPQNQGTAQEIVRKFASSKLFLMAAIAFTVALVLSILLGGGVTPAALKNLMQDSLNTLEENGFAMADIPPEIERVLQGFMAISTAIASLPAIALAVGLWLVYYGGKQRQDRIALGGFATLRVMAIVFLVLIGAAAAWTLLVFVLFTVLMATGFSGSPDAVESAVMTATVPVVMVMIAAVFTLCILFYAKILRTVNTVRDTLRTGVASDRVSGFVGGALYGLAGYEVLSLLMLILVLTNPATRDAFQFGAGLTVLFIGGCLTALCIAASEICFGILIFRYRAAMRQLMGKLA